MTLVLFCAVIAVIGISARNKTISYLQTYPSIPPIGAATGSYEQIIEPIWQKPFAVKYFLHRPDHYDPNRAYPVVLLLHGSSRHMYGGKYFLTNGFAERFPAFILIPIAPGNMEWANSETENYDGAQLAMAALNNVRSKYNIDRSRIYISGYSLGGIGTLGMIEKYPDVFAAGLVLCGEWGAERAGRFPSNVPLRIIWGDQDTIIPSPWPLVAAFKDAGIPVEYIEYKDMGHNIWDRAYQDPGNWSWLFSKRRD